MRLRPFSAVKIESIKETCTKPENSRIDGYPSRVRVGTEQGPYMSSLEHLGRSKEAKDSKKYSKSKT